MARKQPTPPPPPRAERHPLDVESTDWGRQQNRRHVANLREIRGIKGEISKMKVELADNTTLTRSVDERLAKLVDSTDPYVKLRQAVIKSGERAKSVGRYTTAAADWLLRYGKIGVLLIGAIVLFRAWSHGENPKEAITIIWQILSH